MNRTQFSSPLWDAVTIALLLIAALNLHGAGEHHRYGYYESLRNTVSIAWLAAGLRFFHYKWLGVGVICGLVVALFNPILPVTMHKYEWRPYDFWTMLGSIAAAAALAYRVLRARAATTA